MLDAFLILSKLGGTVAKPETWVVLVLLVALAALALGWHRVTGWLLAGLTLALAALAIWPLGDLALHPLEQRFAVAPDLQTPAAILVLGGAEDAARTDASGLVSVTDGAERFLQAIALARRFPEARVIFTGGTGWFVEGRVSGAEVARRLFVEAGLDPARLTLEGRSRTTWQNAVFSRPMAEDPGGTGATASVVLVTSAYHMARSSGTFCAAGWTGLVAWPVDHRATGWDERWGWNLALNLQDLNVAAREWLGWLAYRVTGRAAPYSVANNNRILCGRPE